MKLYILRPLNKDVREFNPWYDKNFGYVIRAKNKKSARKLAEINAGDEGEDVWLDNEKTSCEILESEGTTELIMIDCRMA